MGSLSELLEKYENNTELLKLILPSKMEEDRRKAEEEITKRKVNELKIEEEKTKRIKLQFQSKSLTGSFSFTDYFNAISPQIQTNNFLHQTNISHLLPAFNSLPPTTTSEKDYQSYFFNELKSFLKNLGSSLRIEDTHNVPYLNGTSPDLSFFLAMIIFPE